MVDHSDFISNFRQDLILKEPSFQSPVRVANCSVDASNSGNIICLNVDKPISEVAEHSTEPDNLLNDATNLVTDVVHTHVLTDGAEPNLLNDGAADSNLQNDVAADSNLQNDADADSNLQNDGAESNFLNDAAQLNLLTDVVLLEESDISDSDYDIHDGDDDMYEDNIDYDVDEEAEPEEIGRAHV